MHSETWRCGIHEEIEACIGLWVGLQNSLGSLRSKQMCSSSRAVLFDTKGRDLHMIVIGNSKSLVSTAHCIRS